jgi:hypothetical protein
MNIKVKFLIISMLTSSFLFSQNKPSQDTLSSHTENQIKHRHTLGSSFFMLGNFLEDSPDYYLLNYGFRLTKKSRIFVEFNTWRYSEPLGTYPNSEKLYPGFVRAFGLGLGYQYFFWKGMYAKVQVTPFSKQYHDNDDNKTQKGFQLYNQLVAGYRFEFFKKRFFIEPAYALKYWPIDTNFPSEFAKIEEGKPKYIFEPSLNFGFKF